MRQRLSIVGERGTTGRLQPGLSRAFLDRLFPLDDRCGDATDSACLAAAPYLGDVVTVPEPLVHYRVHGDNRSALLIEPRRFTRQLERACQRERLAR